ncbi:MAG: transcriptional regulator, partial [Terracidiphilus sp.]
MSSASSSLRAGYRFGPFTLDLRSGDLSRNGRRIRLQEKARSLLVALAERPGETVTRSELHDRLWPENTFVDFEEGLNAAMSKLREALGDNSQSPRYIETVRGRGYRFIANVDSINASLETALDSLAGSTDRNGDSPALGVAQLSANASPNMQPTGDASFEERLKQPFPSIRAWWRWRLIAAGASAFVLALSAGGYFYSHRAPKLTEKDTVVLCDFSNHTGNAIFDDALNTALAVSLRQSPFINVLPESDVATTLQLMSRPANAELTPEVARELCQRAGSKAFIAGSIGSLGSEYVVDLKAVNCQSGDTLAQVQTTAANKEKVLDALGGAASKLRRQLGESLTTVRSFNVPLAQATTSSLEALKALTLGSHIRNQNGEAAALPYFQRAVDLDPNFAMGYRSLSGVYLTLGETERGGGYLTKAFQLRQRASEP